MDDFDVVVAGAGPVGLMLAGELRTAGATVVVLERLAEPDPMTKAGSIGPLAVEALVRRGLGERVLAAERETLERYLRMAEETGADPAHAVPKEHFAGLEKLDLPGGPGPRRRVRVEQPALVDVLLRHTADLGVELRRGHEVVDLDQDGDGVVVTARTPAGRARVRGRYLVGCDGANSAVRELAGFGFPGTGATVTGRQGVVELAGDDRLPHGFHHTPRGLVVYGLGVNRVASVEFDGPPDPGAGPFTAAELEEALRRVSGLDVRVAGMSAGGRFADRACQVTGYRRGRVLVAGDAAHVHAPFGGQGLNVGLTDAVNLGWKLAATARGWAPPGLLDTYSAERHPVGAALLENTRAQTALMRPDPQSAALRGLFDRLLDLEQVRRHVVDLLAGFDVRHDLGEDHPLVGTLPASGGEVFPEGGGAVLDLVGDAEVLKTAAPWSPRVHAVAAATGPDGVDAVALRPDGVVAWVLPTGERFAPESLEQALTRWFGPPPVTR
ncbi:FAD-dependent monooxygenase [Saccharothrix xinjiangensis]|uniref:FAD-dependent monooxygenase n=1 Tax=Saccharothrix xinjiangensis TaxID=204798 RepID=A0ABV9Y9S1_9PSEU